MANDINFTISKEYHFLSEVPDFKDGLPQGYLINKVVTGCGGTTVAINDPYNTVICVPFIALVECKCNYNENIMGVYSGVGVDAIKWYLDSYSGAKKIMCTYDSLGKVLDVINPEEYRLLVDEYHLLFGCYDFRREAIRQVLDNFKKFKSYSFMTATPIPFEFMLEELKGIPNCTIDWEDKTNVTVKGVKVKSVQGSVMSIVQSFLKGDLSGNAHFFINSVDFIATIVERMKLNNDNCRVIISRHNKGFVNDVEGVKIGRTFEPTKKINFYTSTCFEGCDLFDVDGRIFVISDPIKKNTMLDIATQIPQIAGRIRNSKYSNEITHIYKNTRYNGVTQEEFDASVERCKADAIEFVELVNNSAQLIKGIKESEYDYVVKMDDKWVFDENIMNLDKRNFRLLNFSYNNKINISNAYKGVGFRFVSSKEQPSDLLFANDKAKVTFKDAVKEYLELQSKENTIIFGADDRRRKLVYRYNFLPKAVELLGADKLEELDYNVGNIKRELIKLQPKDNEKQIGEMLLTVPEFKTGGILTSKQVKQMLGEIYNELGIEKTPMVDDLKPFVDFVPCSTRIDGKKTRVFKLLYIKIPRKYVDV